MLYDSLADELFYILSQFSKNPFQEHSRNFATGEMSILYYLDKIQDGATAGDICNYMQVTTGRVASALNSLEKKHYIQRRNHDIDKRKVIVYITESGKEYILENYQNGITLAEDILSNLGEEDAKELIRLIKKSLNM